MRPLFLFKSEKKTDEGHLKQMREGLRNNLFFSFGLINIFSLPLLNYSLGNQILDSKILVRIANKTMKTLLTLLLFVFF